MNFAFSDEQEAFREVLRRFLADKSPPSEVRRLMETPGGYDPPVWKQMAADLALQGLHVPGEYGGAGFGFLELVIVLEEMGRTLFCSPYFSTVGLAANAILNAGTEEEKRALLPRIASGETTAALALNEPDGSWDPAGIAFEATRQGGDYILNGAKTTVVDGCTASLIVVAARKPGTHGAEGISLLTVSGDAQGLTRTPLTAMDATRKLARLDFSDVRASLLGAEGASRPALERTLDQAAVCLAAESAGGAQKCLDMAVEYAKLRVQFGRLIGSFQAIKHKCADLLLEVESAKSTAYYAGWAAAEDNEELPLAASLAKACCSEAYGLAAAECIQIHGGIGFSWEHDAHLYFKRAKSSEQMLGDPTFHRARIADRIGI